MLCATDMNFGQSIKSLFDEVGNHPGVWEKWRFHSTTTHGKSLADLKLQVELLNALPETERVKFMVDVDSDLSTLQKQVTVKKLRQKQLTQEE